MYYLKIKDNKKRQRFKKFELHNTLKFFVYKNILSLISKNPNLKYKHMLYFRILKRKKRNLSTKMVRRCIVTNRSKSIRPFKISRILARELIGFGVIPGFSKAVW